MDSAETAEFAPDRNIPKTRMNFWGGFPFPATSTLRVLGVTLDMFFDLIGRRWRGVITGCDTGYGVLAWRAGVTGVTLDHVLGVTLDHYTDVLIKAQTRHGLLAKVANAGWGLELGALKMTPDSVITS